MRLSHGRDNLFRAAAAESENWPAHYCAALIESLTTHKSTSIAAELEQNPRIALAAVVHAHVLSRIGCPRMSIPAVLVSECPHP